MAELDRLCEADDRDSTEGESTAGRRTRGRADRRAEGTTSHQRKPLTPPAALWADSPGNGAPPTARARAGRLPVAVRDGGRQVLALRLGRLNTCSATGKSSSAAARPVDTLLLVASGGRAWWLVPFYVLVSGKAECAAQNPTSRTGSRKRKVDSRPPRRTSLMRRVGEKGFDGPA